MKCETFDELFRLQMAVIRKYDPIENANGLLQTPMVPVALSCRFGQARIKDFAWRITEELMEARLELTRLDRSDAAREEVIDALHFMIELCILADVEPTAPIQFIKQRRRSTDEAIMAVIYHLGMACNELKNRPWKQTQTETDESDFRGWIQAALTDLVLLMDSVGIAREEILDHYTKKNKVVMKRPEEGY